MLVERIACLLALLLSTAASNDKQQFWIRLGDNTAAGTQVGSLNAHPILRNYSYDGVRPNRSFSIIGISSDGAQYFRLEPSTGVIFTARAIDRDDLCSDSRLCCENELVCTFSFRALVTIGKTQLVPLVHVSLTDQNDNAPRFAVANIALEVLESNEPRSMYRAQEQRLPPATDLDSKNYSIREYRLITSEPRKFALRKPQSLTDASEMLVLMIQEPLDREEQNSYQMTIVAYDGGQPSLSSNMSVVIHVRDANDHQPIFQDKAYSVSIPETFPVGDVVVQLNATDKDEGENGRVVYEFDQSVSDDVRRRFVLDSTTGTLRLDSPLDFEMHRFYRFIVLAHDAVESAKFDKATVTVTVTDVNDEYPVIDITAFDETAQTSESVRPGTIVMYMKVYDKEGFSGNCTIDNPRFGLELLESNRQPGTRGFEYNIVTRMPLDRERNSAERMRIRCYDSAGEQQLDTVREVNLSVADVNDNAPQFVQSSLDVSVFENNSPDEPIGQLMAEDADAAENGELRFQLAGTGGPFRIDSESGQLFSLRALDREERGKYSLPVIVHDLGSPSLTSTATVTVTVLDQNDNLPTFASNAVEFTAAEHERRGTYVGQVRAIDADDSKLAGAVSYSISSGGAPFTVDPRDGVIFTDVDLNREVCDHYVFDVVATDHGDPPLSSTVMVTVRVSDKNDHAPRIHFPDSNASFHVSCIEQIHFLITTVNASDDDLDRNAAMRYSIARGDSSLFRVDPESGALRINRSLTERDCGKRERVTIEVRDGGSPAMRNETTVHVLFDRSLKPSTSGQPDPLARRPAVQRPPAEESAPSEDFDSTVETLLLVVVFAVLLAMLIVTFVVVFMSRKRGIQFGLPCCPCLDPEAPPAHASRKQDLRNRRPRSHVRPRARPQHAEKRTPGGGSDEHVAAVAALLTPHTTDDAVFNMDRSRRTLQLRSETEMSFGSRLANDSNNNNFFSRTLPKSMKNRTRAGDFTAALTVHGSRGECKAIGDSDSLQSGAIDRYDHLQVLPGRHFEPSESVNHYLPADRMHVYDEESESMQPSLFADDGTPLKLIPLDANASHDALVMCNPQSFGYATCSNCSETPNLDAVVSRTLMKNMQFTSPLRFTPRVATTVSDYSATSARSKSASSCSKAFPQIENSMI